MARVRGDQRRDRVVLLMVGAAAMPQHVTTEQGQWGDSASSCGAPETPGVAVGHSGADWGCLWQAGHVWLLSSPQQRGPRQEC